MLEVLARGAFERELERLDKRIIEHRNWTVLSSTFPVLDVVFNHPSRPLRLRLTCDGWDDEPPSMEILTVDGTHVPSTRPAGVYEYLFAGGMSIFHSGPHERTGRPFICMRGSREFHTHASHLNEHWDNYRGMAGNDILGLLEQLWRVWLRATKQ